MDQRNTINFKISPGDTRKNFLSLPVSMILRMGYGFGEEFGAFGEESLFLRHSIYYRASKNLHPTSISLPLAS